MLEWINANVAWWHWMAAGLLLALGEMLVPSFMLLLIGVSAAVVGALLLIWPLSFNAQILIWAALSVANVAAWFAFVQPKIRTKSLSGMALEALIGQMGTLTEANAATQRGRIRFPAPIQGSDEWSCILQGELKIGDRVTVLQISGNNLVVGTMAAA